MPTFRQQRPRSITNSMRALLSSSPDPTAADYANIDHRVAQAAHQNALAEKVRLELEDAREADRLRRDPNAAAEYASVASGLDVPTGNRLAGAIRGLVEQPATAVDDEGNPNAPSPYMRPESVSPEQERAFRANLASTMANRMATGKTNADQFTRGGGNLLVQAIRNEMTQPDIELPRENQLGHAAGIRSREPFRTNAQGTVLNEETGELEEGGQLAAAARAAVESLGNQREAAAGLSGERATDLSERRPARIELDEGRARAAREGRPAPQRTDAQEARDRAYAARATAAAEAAQTENDTRAQARARASFRGDAQMRGKKLGRWVRGQGFEVLDDTGKVIGYYD